MRKVIFVCLAASLLQGCAAALAGAQLASAAETREKAKSLNCEELIREWRLASDVGLISPKGIYAEEIREKNCRV